MRRGACLLGLLGAFAVGGVAPAFAGDVVGKVSLTGSGLTESEAGLPPRYWSVWNGALPFQPIKRDIRRELTVAIVGGDNNARGCDYAVRGGGFVPRTLVLPKGKAMRVTNRDAVDHLLVIGGERISVASGGTWEANGEGAVENLWVGTPAGYLATVPKLAACATVASDGSYRAKSLPAGDYQVVVFWRGKKVATRKLKVEDRGTEAPEIQAHLQEVR